MTVPDSCKDGDPPPIILIFPFTYFSVELSSWWVKPSAIQFHLHCRGSPWVVGNTGKSLPHCNRSGAVIQAILTSSSLSSLCPPASPCLSPTKPNLVCSAAFTLPLLFLLSPYRHCFFDILSIFLLGGLMVKVHIRPSHSLSLLSFLIASINMAIISSPW